MAGPVEVAEALLVDEVTMVLVLVPVDAEVALVVFAGGANLYI
jgi:hypothetical protein